MTAIRAIARFVTAAAVGATLATAAPAQAQPPVGVRDYVVPDGAYRIKDPATTLLLTAQDEEPRQRVTMSEPSDGEAGTYQVWDLTCREALGCALRNRKTTTYLALTGLPSVGKHVITKPTPYQWLITGSVGQGGCVISRAVAPSGHLNVSRSDALVRPPLVDLQEPNPSDARQQWEVVPLTE
ncbi:hypothetical protein [Actinophytocola oryzae]|uniref:Ricin-type beta-trefoil lectin protein n=1 Tax=Actinophytocola oryzae TaxID=502181 RepID=A0A4R7W475_9PSEU|nr:hypothetical protein [Actinophytocola oryzae]TDV57302.1 hypothetical protein CLV71_101173 [Actinophytocola oryzae]